MLEIIKAGGWVMAPIIICSLLSLAIFCERIWTLRRDRIVPRKLAAQVWQWSERNMLDAKHLEALRRHSPLGQIMAAGLVRRHLGREAVKEGIEDAGRHVVHELERYVSALSAIAAISPLLGLLGTVLGMIRMFTSITQAGIGDPSILASGISEALITTAAGLLVAIPSVIFYYLLKSRVADLLIQMERQAINLLDALFAGQALHEKPLPVQAANAAKPAKVAVP
jgi:biopolymer transport protein ExbB